MSLKKYLLFVFLAFSALGFSQEIELSPLSKISLLTVGAADDLSSKFGHTAIRIQDSAIHMDIVFGYGGFDFEDPLFYYKFTTGKLDYSMTGHRFNGFLESYKIQNRWVREQELNFSVAQRNQLFQFLKNNHRKENRYYKYDFLFDNCATKVPEVFNDIFDSSLKYDSSHLKEASTFRQLIHEYLDENSWSAFGIDLALGSVIDREASSWEHQFLPFYVKEQFENTRINGEPLVIKEELILDVKPISEKKHFILSPLFWLIILLVLTIAITYRDYKNNKRSRWLDFTLSLSTGIAGLIICFLWFATNHSSTKINFNILWAAAPNLIAAFYLLKKKLPKWISKYLWIVLGGIVLTGILWLFKIQVFSPLILFILLALAIRYVFLLKKEYIKKKLNT